MAKEIVRQDVVQISFDITDNPLKDLLQELEEMKKIANGSVEGVEDSFKDLKDTTESVRKGFSDIAKEKFTSLKNSLKNTKDKLTDIAKHPIAKVTEGLKKIAQTSLSKLKTGLSTIKTKLTEIAKKSGELAWKGLKKMAGVSFKALVAGVGAAATAVGFLVKSSVSAYADYEQLIGGVETLFKDSASVVEKYANNAYKTAGLSANAYMETVTGFSASLLQSLGGDTKKAAEYADMAISDMSDNANKMGTSMESIQFAYQGFAKQNYTMLDNLKLGYGGTKTEMQRLVKEAAKLDKSVDRNSLSYGNIVKAIHAVQVKMGIYGTTAKEASTTITGSLNSMKAAWGNLLPALIKGGDQFDQCVDNLIESIVGVKNESGELEGGIINNLKPAIEKALSGVGRLIDSLAPIIAKEFPTLVSSLLPPLLSATTSIVQGLVKALPSILKTATNSMGTAVNGLTEAIISLLDISPQLVRIGVDLIDSLVDGVSQAIPTLIPALTDSAVRIIKSFAVQIPSMIDIGIDLIMTLAEGILSALPMLIDEAPKIITYLINAITTSLPRLVSMGIQLITQLINGLTANLPAILNSSSLIIDAVVAGLVQAIPFLLGSIPEIFGAFINGIMSVNWIDVGKTIIGSIWQGIKDLGFGLINGIKDLFSGKNSDLSDNGATAGSTYANGLIKTINNMPTPSDVVLQEKLGFDFAPAGTKSAETFVNSVTKEIGAMDLTNEGSDTVQGLINGMNSKKQAAVESARAIANAINGEYRKIQDIHSPSRVWEKFGAYQIQGNIKGIENNLPKLEATVQQAGVSSMPRYSPESSTTTNNRTTNTTYSPSFVLNMNGASATDSNKRKVKRWIQEAITETFDTMGRANPQLIEV